MALTPGLRFLLKSIAPAVLGLAIAIHCLLLLVHSYYPSFNLAHNAWILRSIYLCGGIIYYYFRSIIVTINTYLVTKKLGIQLVPRVRGWLPGNFDLILKGLTSGSKDYVGEVWVKFFEAAGGSSSCSLDTLGDDRIFTRNPKNIQRMLATDFENYQKGSLFAGITESLLGTGVFNSDGEMWQFHRKLARPFFSKERVTDFLLYERKAMTCVQKMEEHFDRKLPIDFQDLVARFTLDSAAEFLLGVSTNSLDAPLPLPHNFPSPAQKDAIASTPSSRFSKAWGIAQVVLLDRFDLAHLWPLGEIFEDKMKEPMKVVKPFVEAIIRNAMNKRDKGDSNEGETLLSHLLGVTEDMKTIVDQTLNILLAGRDTTASLITFTIYCMALYPGILQRLRKEISDVVGLRKVPTYEDIRAMKYLRAVINETLRLYPPVPFNLRESVGETYWFNDNDEKVFIPPSTRLPFSIFHLHRDPKQWGPDAHIFDPDRWLDSRISKYTSNPFIYIPFNAGPRICLGQQFALNEASYFIVRICQHFEQFDLRPEYQPPHTSVPEEWRDPTTVTPLTRRRVLEQCFMRSHLTLYVDGGLWLSARQAGFPIET